MISKKEIEIYNLIKNMNEKQLLVCILVFIISEKINNISDLFNPKELVIQDYINILNHFIKDEK